MGLKQFEEFRLWRELCAAHPNESEDSCFRFMKMQRQPVSNALATTPDAPRTECGLAGGDGGGAAPETYLVVETAGVENNGTKRGPEEVTKGAVVEPQKKKVKARKVSDEELKH